ncbi:MAG: hypothetical protein O3A92_09985 [Verrucomicrobia bacterium]|nr:hypothetical protein [Verrucomicrobiota bacterium]
MRPTSLTAIVFLSLQMALHGQKPNLQGRDLGFPDQAVMRRVRVAEEGSFELEVKKGNDLHSSLSVYCGVSPAPGVIYKEKNSWNSGEFSIHMASIFLEEIGKGELLLMVKKKGSPQMTILISATSEQFLNDWIAEIKEAFDGAE